jgi:hypothetical protein
MNQWCASRLLLTYAYSDEQIIYSLLHLVGTPRNASFRSLGDLKKLVSSIKRTSGLFPTEMLRNVLSWSQIYIYSSSFADHLALRNNYVYA